MWRRVGVVLLLIVVAASAFNYLRPIPAVAATHLLHPTEVVPGTAPSLPWPSRGSAAVAVSGLGFVGTSGNEQAIPAASVTKVMTALVVLEDSKLKKGETGANITITDADVRSYEADLADTSGASASSVSTPTDLTTLGMVAMQNEVFAQVVALGQANLPVAGTVYNVNGLLGQGGIVGIKTGSGLNTGANFLFAANVTVDS